MDWLQGHCGRKREGRPWVGAQRRRMERRRLRLTLTRNPRCHQDCDEVKFDDLNKLNNATTRILHWMSDDAMRLTTLTHLVVDCIYDLIPCERVTVYCVDRAKDELWVAISRDIKGLRIPLGTGLVGTVAETGVAANIENCQKHGDAQP
mmetsp:Transcript_21369/g.65211  ORF Transcript_21369/g.65211 Transcript_21369/m.65211 type:complete len:149 (-) Transcript_21369:2177-2623(-)